MMFPSRIAAVSYLNTIPFIYGIEHARLMRADLSLSPPAGNVEAFLSGAADIALIPSGAIPLLSDARIITDFCIGASGPVRTVVIVSDAPVEQARRVWLDGHSRTSALLVRILCAGLWGITPEFVPMDDYSVADDPHPGDAFLLIGDKVFEREGRFAYVYDLAEEWRRLTALPMAFAVWVARPEVAAETVEALERSLEYGVAHIPEAVARYGYGDTPYAEDYLKHNIDFILDPPKKEALSLFWEKAHALDPRATPG